MHIKRMAGPANLEEELRRAETYEDYLDSFITEEDRLYLQEVRDGDKK